MKFKRKRNGKVEMTITWPDDITESMRCSAAIFGMGETDLFLLIYKTLIQVSIQDPIKIMELVRKYKNLEICENSN